jgi:hypothetical protein
MNSISSINSCFQYGNKTIVVQWLVPTLLLALAKRVVSWGTPPMSSRVLQLYVGENDGGGSLTCISAILGTYAYIQ